MTNTKPDKPERQTKEQTKGNLGQKEAQLKKDKVHALVLDGEVVVFKRLSCAAPIC
jgi:hypothetical protein